jgi:hypothetical protein
VTVFGLDASRWARILPLFRRHHGRHQAGRAAARAGAAPRRARRDHIDDLADAFIAGLKSGGQPPIEYPDTGGWPRPSTILPPLPVWDGNGQRLPAAVFS